LNRDEYIERALHYNPSIGHLRRKRMLILAF
jgi:hypothetical protein